MNESLERLTTALADRYSIERELGAGGMATVYLAADLKHDRKVAIKVLRPELAAVLGAERFVQEIKTTASLQHPHILPLHDSGEADSFLYYVMPYIEGETLRDKLNREKQLGIDEAVRIATEVADALDYAHRHNVIHRDIKPENILLHDGRPMVADFGIALAVSAAAGGRMTETGLSLGTPHYMSPEQATAEKDLTNRSDIYSLGAALYEMLTGDPPHVGSSAQQIIMKIVTEEPAPVTKTRKSVPPNVAAATAKALEKLPPDRFESAQEFARALADRSFFSVSPEARGHRLKSTLLSMPVALLGWGFAIAFAALWFFNSLSKAPDSVVRYSMRFPDAEQLSGPELRLAVSPDGTRLAYTGGRAGEEHRLWIRARDELNATPIPESEGATSPFFSPDGEQVGFMIDGVVKFTSRTGGSPITVSSTSTGRRGASWSSDGYIYVGPFSPQPLMRVPAAGGLPSQFTTLDSARGETDHLWPDAMPGGNGVIFTVAHGPDLPAYDIAVAHTSTGHHAVLTSGVMARYAVTGHLVFITADGVMMGAPFDQDRLVLTGDPVPLLGGARVVGRYSAADFALSSAGTLFYGTGADPTPRQEERGLVWVARDGEVEDIAPGWIDVFTTLAISPDGRALAVAIGTADGGHQVWIKPLDGSPPRMLTFAGMDNHRPSWPANDVVVFVSDRDTYRSLYRKNSDGSGAAVLDWDLEGEETGVTYERDGKWLLYRVGVGYESDIHGIRIGVDSVPRKLLVTEDRETQPRVSPDGRWLAYVRTERGASPEIYVVPFPNTADGGPWLVSPNGGTGPTWDRTGRELFYRSSSGEMVSVEIVPGPAFRAGRQESLFDMRDYHWSVWDRQYDVAPNDGRFAMIRRARARSSIGELIVVESFFEELQEKVGN